MKLSSFFKNIDPYSEKIFCFAILLSILLHSAFLYESRTQSMNALTSLDAKKGKKVFINCNLKNSVFQKEIKKITNEKLNKKRSQKKGTLSSKTDEKEKKKEQKQEKSDFGGHASTALERQKARDTYEAKVLRRIQRMKFYPLSAKRRRKEGVVRVKFSLSRDGFLSGDVAILEKVKHLRLNRAAVKTILRASPFPPFPQKTEEKNMTFMVDIVYKLDVF